MANQHVLDLTISGKDKSIQPDCITMGDLMSGQCFKQDRGQGHCKNNATSNQNFKHDRG